MKDVLTVFFKEMRRFFTDRRTLAALFIPGVLIFVVYTIMGNLVSSQIDSLSSSPENTEFRIAYTDNYGMEGKPVLIQGMELVVSEGKEGNSVLGEAISTQDVEAYKEKVKNEELHLLIVFSEEFEKNVIGSSSSTDNSISFFYNAASSVSSYIYSLTTQLVPSCYDKYQVNVVDGSYQDPNLGEGDYAMGQVMSFLFPMLTIALLFSTILTICPESIAGEKERGTIASLLLTPAKRTHLAIGKILALSVTAIASGFVSFLGIILSLPELFGGTVDFFSVFTPGAIVVLFFLIITALFLFVTMGLFVSAFAKSVKEANAYLTPVMIVLMVMAIVPSIVDLSNIGFAFVPLLDIIVSMNLIIVGAEASLLIPYIAVTIVMNLILSGVFIFLVAKIFDDEKVMFTR